MNSLVKGEGPLVGVPDVLTIARQMIGNTEVRLNYAEPLRYALSRMQIRAGQAEAGRVAHERGYSVHPKLQTEASPERDPRCTCAMVRRAIVPEEHDETCPVVGLTAPERTLENDDG